MRKSFRHIGTGLLLGAGVAVGAALYSGGATSASPPFGDDASVKYSKDLWSALAKAGMVGKNAKPDKPYKGQEPHGAILETLEGKVKVNGHTGRVLVKRNYGPGGISTDDVMGNRAKHLKAVTVMFQRDSGYDSDNKNWFWVKYKANGSLHTNPKGMKLAGRVAKGMDKGCIACHSTAGGGDYIFRND